MKKDTSRAAPRRVNVSSPEASPGLRRHGQAIAVDAALKGAVRAPASPAPAPSGWLWFQVAGGSRQCCQGPRSALRLCYRRDEGLGTLSKWSSALAQHAFTSCALASPNQSRGGRGLRKWNGGAWAPCFCPTHSSLPLCLLAALPRLFLLPLKSRDTANPGISHVLWWWRRG